jgi:hypothetical protein
LQQTHHGLKPETASALSYGSDGSSSILAEHPDFFTKLMSQISNNYSRLRERTLDSRADLWHLVTLAFGEDLRLQNPASRVFKKSGVPLPRPQGENKTHCKRSR